MTLNPAETGSDAALTLREFVEVMNETHTHDYVYTREQAKSALEQQGSLSVPDLTVAAGGVAAGVLNHRA